MGQAESKEAEQNPGQAPQHARRNTVHGTHSNRTRRPTSPIANPVSQRPSETPATAEGAPPQRPTNTPQSFPRSRGLTNVRPHMTPSTALQRQATTALRTSGRLQQQFAIRPAKTAATSSSGPVLPTPSRSQPIPISQPSTRSRPERPVQERGRPVGRRSAPPPKAAAPTTGSDPEPAGPPAKRVTRSRAAQSASDKTAAAQTPATSTPSAAIAGPSTTKSRPQTPAIAGPSTSKPRSQDARPSGDEPARIGDVEPESADSDAKMSVSVESDSSDDQSDDAASQSSDNSEDPNELDQDLGLESDDDGDEKSEISEEKPTGAAGGPSGQGVGIPPRRPESPRVAARSQFPLRRSRRQSVPVRHLQVDWRRASYLSV